MNVERDPRVILAAERTLLAWIRTGLAMMGFGFVVARFGLFLREMSMMQNVEVERGTGSLWAGVTLVLVGVVAQLYAAITYTRFRSRYRRGETAEPGGSAGIIVATLLAGLGTAMAVYLLMQR